MGWDRRPSKLGMRKTGSRSKTESDLVSCVLWKNWLMFDLIRNSIACSLVIIYTVLGSGKKNKLAANSNGSITVEETRTLQVKVVFINFAHCMKVHNNICAGYTKINAFSKLYGYNLSLYMVLCTFSAQLRPSLLK